jgi:hypothetical protein
MKAKAIKGFEAYPYSKQLRRVIGFPSSKGNYALEHFQSNAPSSHVFNHFERVKKSINFTLVWLNTFRLGECIKNVVAMSNQN